MRSTSEEDGIRDTLFRFHSILIFLTRIANNDILMYIQQWSIIMTAKISKWGNSAAIRLPKEIMEFLSLHIGDNVRIEERDNTVVISHINDKKARIIAEAERIREHAQKEYAALEGTLGDGLDAV